MKDALYHVGRLAWLAGQENVPWHLMVRLLRQGVQSEHGPQELDPKVFQQYPILTELKTAMLAVTPTGEA